MNNFGCPLLESGINFDYEKVTDCCILHHDKKGLPLLIDNYNGEGINWEELFDKKSQRIACQQKETIPECEGCYRLEENYTFTQERKISDFHFSQCHLCNAKCVYCSDLFSLGRRNYDVFPIIKDLIEKGYYREGGEATFQGGEPTLMPNFDELIHLFTKHGTTVRVHTSAIKYSQTVEEALKENQGSVVISLDSGCSETYKKIKQVDCFNVVCETIQNYAKASAHNVIIKYILIPGYNDNLKEIDKFFKLMKSFNIKNVALDIELQYAEKYNNKHVSDHIFLLVDYFKYQTKLFGIKLHTYSFLSYVLQNRTIKESSLVKNNFLYGLYLKKYTDKSKNIEYKR